MKYAWIHEHRAQFPIDMQCDVLGTSRSGFHSWMKMRCVCTKAAKDAILLAAIPDAHKIGRSVCGAKKIRTLLADQDIHIDNNSAQSGLGD